MILPGSFIVSSLQFGDMEQSDFQTLRFSDWVHPDLRDRVILMRVSSRRSSFRSRLVDDIRAGGRVVGGGSTCMWVPRLADNAA